jgi:hypothetical protein
MQIPPAGLIEAAKDELSTVEVPVLIDQRKELHVANVGPDTKDFRLGYELGLQTARVMIRQNPDVVLHIADPAKIL